MLLQDTYMSAFMKTVLISTQPPWHFSKKIHRLFHKSTTGSLSTHSLLTHLACVWLAGCQPLRLQGTTGQGCPAKKMSSLTEENASLCDPLHPPGVWAWRPLLVSAGSQAPGLSSSTLLDGSLPLAFQAPQRPPYRLSLPAWMFCCKFDTVFINSDIYTANNFQVAKSYGQT